MLVVIPVDFNNAAEDEAIRLITEGTLQMLEETATVLSEGMRVIITDDGMYAEAVISRRGGMWVATISHFLDGEPAP